MTVTTLLVDASLHKKASPDFFIYFKEANFGHVEGTSSDFPIVCLSSPPPAPYPSAPCWCPLPTTNQLQTYEQVVAWK